MTDDKLKEIQGRVRSGCTFSSDTRALLNEVLRLRAESVPAKPKPAKKATKTVTPPKAKAKPKAKKNAKPRAPPPPADDE